MVGVVAAVVVVDVVVVVVGAAVVLKKNSLNHCRQKLTHRDFTDFLKNRKRK